MKKIILILIFSIVIFGCSKPIQIELDTKEVNLEIGSEFDPVSHLVTEVEDINIESNVDTSKIGTYKVEYSKEDVIEVLSVNIVDTIAPTATVKSNSTVLGKKFTANDFVSDISDSSEVVVSFETDIDFTKEVYDEPITIILTDSSGNVTKLNTTYSIDGNPDRIYISEYFDLIPLTLSYTGSYRIAVRDYNSNSQNYNDAVEVYKGYINGMVDLPNNTKYKSVTELVKKSSEKYLQGLSKIDLGISINSDTLIESGFDLIDEGIDLLWDAADKIEELKSK